MKRTLLSLLASSAVVATALTSLNAPATNAAAPAAKPDRVVVILVDALSREIVNKYDMTNAKALMADGVNSKNAVLGHVGSVTVVTHNVITSGRLPKNMGWSSEGYRDNGTLAGFNANPYWFTSDWSRDQMYAVQNAVGGKRLPDYLHEMRPGSKVITVSPKAYAAYAFGGPTSDITVTFSSRNYDCDGDGVNNWRGPTGVNVPAYLSSPTCGRYYVDSTSSKYYDTNSNPAWMYPLDGNRYTNGYDPEHQGSDVWSADAAIAAMQNEDWSGVFVSLPGVDKAAHMWGSIDDPEGADPISHMENATAVADAQIGKIMDYLRTSGQLDNTVVVLTADHGSVPGRHFHGINDGTINGGFTNWYYGTGANGTYLKPQPALQPLVNTGNLAQAYSDSQLAFWLNDTSPAKLSEAAALVGQMPDVSAVWVRQGSRYQRVGPARYDRMSKAEAKWFMKWAQPLVNSAAGPTGPDIIGTLIDDTTYSVAGDHGGIQRRTQQIPIVFAGAGLSSEDIGASVRSVDIMPTLLRMLGVTPTTPLDGVAYRLPME
ncbi:MAG: alkaline phosphatase family protein [Nocardioides sp.]